MKERGWYGNAKTKQQFNQQKFFKSFARLLEMKRIGQSLRNPESLHKSDLQSEQDKLATKGQNCHPYAGGIALNCRFHQLFPSAYLVHFKGSLWRSLKLLIVSARDWRRKQCGLCFTFRDLKRVCEHINISRFLWNYFKVHFFHIFYFIQPWVCAGWKM